MGPLIALMITPLLIWVGVFVFTFVLDGRVRELERRLNERRKEGPSR